MALTGWILIVIAPAVGSFAALLADRFEREEGFVFGGSRCDHCGAPLAARDVAPILSWLWAWAAAGGRARCCGAPLRLYHPAVELSALGLAIWAVLATPSPGLAAITAALGWTLLALALIDLRVMRLPDALTLPLAAAGLGLSLAGLTGPPMSYGLGAAAGYGLFAAIGAFYHWRRGIEGLGLGDAKLLAAAGAWVGFEGVPSVLLIGSLLGLAHALALGLWRREGGGLSRETAAPFGPALAVGFWLTWVQGPLVLV